MLNDSLSCAGTSIEINITKCFSQYQSSTNLGKKYGTSDWLDVSNTAGRYSGLWWSCFTLVTPVQICTALIMMEVSNLRVSIIEHICMVCMHMRKDDC